MDHAHCGVASALGCRLVWVRLTSLNAFASVLLHWLADNILLCDHLGIGWLLVEWLHGLLMPVLSALKLTALVRHGVWGTHVDGCSRLVVVAGVHCSTQALVDGMLLAAALQTITQQVGIVLMRLVGQTGHLTLVADVGLARLLGAVNVLLVLHVFEAD